MAVERAASAKMLAMSCMVSECVLVLFLKTSGIDVLID